MVNENIRELLNEVADENAVVFDNPSFDNSIIGISYTDGGIVYSLDKMVKELAKDDNITEEEAYEFIDYNTIRAIPYCGDDRIKPIIVDDTLLFMDNDEVNK